LRYSSWRTDRWPPRIRSRRRAGSPCSIGIIGAALTFWLWSYGLEHTMPTRVAITVTLNPVMAMALAVPLLGEAISPRLVIGLLGVVAGIALAAWPFSSQSMPPLAENRTGRL
jgi:drug/metabolite transporter (DMT)-like permease